MSKRFNLIYRGAWLMVNTVVITLIIMSLTGWSGMSSKQHTEDVTGMAAGPTTVAVERGDGWLRNAGNTDIWLEREDGSGLSGMVIGIGENITVGSEENVTAKQV